MQIEQITLRIWKFKHLFIKLQLDPCNLVTYIFTSQSYFLKVDCLKPYILRG